MRYMVVVEQGPTCFGAYVPDLPGCAAVGSTRKVVLQSIQKAIESHIDGFKEKGASVPMPKSCGEYVDYVDYVDYVEPRA